MHVNIDETGSDHETIDVDDALARLRHELANLGNDTAPNSNVSASIELLAGIDDATTPQQQARRHYGISRMEKDRLAARMGPEDGLAVQIRVVS